MNAQLDTNNINAVTIARWLSKFALSECERIVLAALYADKKVITERDIEELADAWQTKTVFIKYCHGEGLIFLRRVVKPVIIRRWFGTGEILPAPAVVTTNAAVWNKPPVVKVEKDKVGQLLQLSPFEYVLFSLAYRADAGMLGDEAIASLINLFRQAYTTDGVLPAEKRFTRLIDLFSQAYTEDGEMLSNEEIARLIKSDTRKFGAQATKRSIECKRQRAANKLRAAGISVWHYLGQRITELDIEALNGKRADKPTLSALQQALQKEVDLMLGSLRDSEMQCLRERCMTIDDQPKTNKQVCAAFAEDGRPMNKRTLEKHFEAISKALQKHKINLWTVLMAYTNGHPEILIEEKWPTKSLSGAE